MLFFLLAGILGLLMRTQLAVPSNTFLGQETYNQIFTMHGTVMMFLFAVPAVEAMGILLLPQMLGARDLPFPAPGRLRLLGLFRRRARVLQHAFFDLAPSGGWFMYPPLTSSAILAGHRRGLLAAGHRLHRDLRHCGRHRDHRRHAADARARA